MPRRVDYEQLAVDLNPPVSQLRDFGSRFLALGVDSEPVGGVEFCDSRVQFTFTPLGIDFGLSVWSILSSNIGFKVRQVRVDFGPTEVAFWPPGVDLGFRFGFALW